MPEQRLSTSQLAANALVEANAIDLTAVANIIGKHPPDAISRGDDLALVIGKHNFLACGWPVDLIQDRLANTLNPTG